MPALWSQVLATEFGVSLPPDVVDWLDGDLRVNVDSPHLGDFGEPVDPERLLDPSSSEVWGGQMPPDTIPILGNGCGDTILLRFGTDGCVSELIHWDHETGYWKPFGETIAEAMLCDIGSMKYEGALDQSDEVRGTERLIENWAVDWVRRTSGPTLRWPDPFEGDSLSIFRTLLDAGVCEVVARRELCCSELTCGLMAKCRDIGGWRIAERLGVGWPVVSGWLFDTTLIPDEHREKLSQVVGSSIDELLQQDWDRATDEAQRVQQSRPDLGWPYALMGWAAERRGDIPCAVAHYATGLKALGTSCGFMMQFDDDFAAKRLAELRDHLSNEMLTDPYLCAALTPPTAESFPSSIRHYWMREAVEAEKGGDHRRAYQCYYNAGWDHYVTNDMNGVLDGLVRNAEAAGYAALFRIAKHHRASLEASENLMRELARPANLRARFRGLMRRIFG